MNIDGDVIGKFNEAGIEVVSYRIDRDDDAAPERRFTHVVVYKSNGIDLYISQMHADAVLPDDTIDCMVVTARLVSQPDYYSVGNIIKRYEQTR